MRKIHGLHFILLALSTYTTFVILTKILELFSYNHISKHIKINNFLIDTKGCRIPKLHPFDQSLGSIIKLNFEPYTCSGGISFLNVKPNAIIELNKTVLRDIYGENEIVPCTYQEIIRDLGNPDNRKYDEYVLGPSKTLTYDVPLKEEYIRTSCLVKRKKYEYWLALTPIKDDVEKKCTNRKNAPFRFKNPLINVIYLGIDSTSKLNFQRFFRRTKQFLHTVLKPIELHGYTKVADNSFLNLVPHLTGHFTEKYYNASVRHTMYSDHLDFIWKKYSSIGYRTMYSEDMTSYGTFYYLKNGFKNPPTDYFNRPFFKTVEESKWYKKSKIHCMQDKMEIEVHYDYLRNFVSTMANRFYFAFSFVSKLTHDYINMAAHADDPTARILENLHELGILENSILVFYSDHGIRFGRIRQTFVGAIEERMPFMFLHFPHSFLDANPISTINLMTNQRRLTTPFDIHATISHLFDMINGKSSDGGEYKTEHGISLFNEIPNTRTCQDASILPHWCTCQQYNSIETTDVNVVNSAEAITQTLNLKLKNHALFCETLEIDKILDARVGQMQEEVLKFVEDKVPKLEKTKISPPVLYRVTIQTKPGGGQFEASVQYNIEDNSFRVLDEISRINLYGKDSICINEPVLRVFCYCKNFVH